MKSGKFCGVLVLVLIFGAFMTMDFDLSCDNADRWYPGVSAVCDKGGVR